MLSKVLVALLLALPVVCAQPDKPVAVGPKLVCGEPVWDYGIKPQYQTLTHRLKVSNGGGSSLEIKEVSGTCGCLGGVIGEKMLAPGQSAEIEVKFETRNFRGPTTKVLQVVTNDPDNPRFRLTVTGRVIPPCWLSEAEVTFGDVIKGNSSPEREVKLMIAPGTTLEVKEVQSSHPQLEVRPGEKVVREDGTREWTYRVRLQPGYGVGLVNETVSFVTDLAQEGVVSLRLNGQVVGEVTISPKSFNLGKVARGETPSREVIVNKAGVANLTVQSVEIQPAELSEVFETRIETIEKGKKARVVVTLKPGAPAKYHRGELLIRTNCAGEELHKAYFYAIVR